MGDQLGICFPVLWAFLFLFLFSIFHHKICIFSGPSIISNLMFKEELEILTSNQNFNSILTDFDDILLSSVLKLTLHEPNYKEKEVHRLIR